MAKIVRAKTAKLAKVTASKKKTVVKMAAKAIKKTVVVAAKKTVKAVQAQEKTIKKNTDKIALKAQELLAKKAEKPVGIQTASAKPAVTKAKGALFGKPGGRPPGRRGRRPKNVEYTPSNNEEESYVLENDYETLEYDTGIRLKDGKDDVMSLDRVEDFDEELNFDW